MKLAWFVGVYSRWLIARHGAGVLVGMYGMLVGVLAGWWMDAWMDGWCGRFPVVVVMVMQT